MTLPTTDTSNTTKVRLRDPATGKIYFVRVSPATARKLRERSQNGATVRVCVNSSGSLVDIVGNDASDALKMGLARFGLHVPPLNFKPFLPKWWKDQLRQWSKIRPSGRWLCLFGHEGTGKDTILNILIQSIRREHPDVAVLTLPAEHDDRYVGHLETKIKAFAQVVTHCKDHGLVVIVYLPEIESIFSAGDYNSSWQIQYQAAFRDVLDGTVPFEPDFVLASANNLRRLGGPTLSRFQKIPVPMEPEFVQGVLQAHWPRDLLNGSSCEHVLGRLNHTKIAELTQSSQKKTALRAADLTGLNGRFLRDFSLDLREKIELRREDDPGFVADPAFLDGLLADHLKAIIAPVVEAAGTRSIWEFLVEKPDSFDPPVDVTPTLDWCDESTFVA